MPLGSDDLRSRQRALRRRIVLGTIAVALALWAIWRSWGLEGELLWEMLLGAVVLVVATALLGGIAAAVVAVVRRRRDD